MTLKSFLTKMLGGWLVAATACAQDLSAGVSDCTASSSMPVVVVDTVMPASALILRKDSVAVRRPDFQRRTDNYRKFWYSLIPNQFTIQYAGSIGVVAWGPGWHYGKKERWETDLLFGFVPRYHSEATKVTFTVKQRFVPWHLRISSRWTLEPLATGLFFSSIFGEDFWNHEPSRYPDRYYGFSTKIRANVFLGQRATYKIPSKRRYFCKSVSIYYELSTCDMYVISALPNKNVKFTDILSLAAGLRLDVF